MSSYYGKNEISLPLKFQTIKNVNRDYYTRKNNRSNK